MLITVPEIYFRFYSIHGFCFIAFTPHQAAATIQNTTVYLNLFTNNLGTDIKPWVDLCVNNRASRGFKKKRFCRIWVSADVMLNLGLLRATSLIGLCGEMSRGNQIFKQWLLCTLMHSGLMWFCVYMFNLNTQLCPDKGLFIQHVCIMYRAGSKQLNKWLDLENDESVSESILFVLI